MSTHDTIVAISTPPGLGGLGVVRLSGSAAKDIARKTLNLSSGWVWAAWRAALARLPDAEGNAVDEVVVTFFAAPNSYTAEDVVEISCHGSPVVLRHCVDRTLAAGARPAEPGEFTLRAFLNGRIDLPQAEAVQDLIRATTLHQARIAARQMEGSVSRAVSPFKAKLVELIALLEVGIDFAEDDVSVAEDQEILGRIQPIEAGLGKLIESYQFGKLVHEGITLAIVGRPNVGKSSLFNRLLDRDRAIVTDIPGTTRDTVSEVFSLDGIPVKLVDTAGIRESEDLVERLGVDRSVQAMADADITLVVIDLSCPWNPEDVRLLARAAEGGLHLVVGSKVDLPLLTSTNVDYIPVSAKTGEGIALLCQRLVETVTPSGFVEPQAGLITNLRQELLLKECCESLGHARQALHDKLPHEMLLVDCYAALRALDELTGATTADDVLNHIFASFCIGK